MNQRQVIGSGSGGCAGGSGGCGGCGVSGGCGGCAVGVGGIDCDTAVGRGREAVEKLLQREGKTAIKLDDLAAQPGFKNAEDLFEVVGKDELSLRTQVNKPTPPRPAL